MAKSQKKSANLSLSEKYQMLYNSMRDGVAFFDIEHGKITDCNQAYADMLGYSKQELMQLTYKQLTPKIWHKFEEDIVKNKIIPTGYSEIYEKEYIKKDGTVFPIELCVWLNKDKRDNINGMWAIIRDITKRKHIELELKRLSDLEKILMEISSTYINLPLNKIHQTLKESLVKLAEFVNADRAYIFDYNFKKQICINTHEYCAEAIEPQINELQAVPLVLIPDWAESHCQGKTIYIPDVSSLPESSLRTILESQDIKSLITVPMMREQQCIGFVGFDYVRQYRTYSEYEQHLLTVFAQMLVNIKQRQQAEIELRIAATVFQAQEGMMICDAKGVILKVNHAFSEITGYSADELVGKTPHLLQSGQHDKTFYKNLWRSIHTTGVWQGEVWNRRKNGEIYPEWLSITAVKNEYDKVSHYVATVTDITERKQAEEHINRLAFYDSLTQLPNRRLLREHIKHNIEINHRTNSQMAVLMMDLDKFKAVNDVLGHAAGDELLKQVGQRIKSRLREMDMVGRLGGDEFVVLMENIEYYEQAAYLADAIIQALKQPFTLQHHLIHIGVSIGIAVHPIHGDSVNTLFDHADTALYHAKHQGRGCFAYFSEAMTQEAIKHIVLENRLRIALEQQQLQVYFQPQVDIATGQIISAEALVRWLDPVQGIIQPDEFIPVAEETGLILALGEWVLRETCKIGKAWLNQGLPKITLAVNVSPYQFNRSNINELVIEILKETDFPAECLELEITESGLMENQEHVMEILNNLRNQGVRLAIDDFGTGYSSLAYLKYFPLDVLKIDKTFIRNVPLLQNDVAITATIIAMAHYLGFNVLAEGVETQEQLKFLQQHGCDMYQGYLCSKPLNKTEFEKLLRQQYDNNTTRR